MPLYTQAHDANISITLDYISERLYYISTGLNDCKDYINEAEKIIS